MIFSENPHETMAKQEKKTMKAYVVQPYYSTNPDDTERCFSEMLHLIDSVSGDADVIVIPEYADVPAAQKNKADFHACIEKYNALILEKARSTAIRTQSTVFVNAADKTPTGYRNTTHAIDKNGNTVGKYYKAHPAPSEVKTALQGGNELDVSYTYEYNEPYVIEIDGIRYGFMTCYDFYFYESFAPLSRKNVDVIIGCSHQRTDTHEALSIINRFLSYNTNAYLIRASVSLGFDSKICGCSSIIAPNGSILVDMKSEIGISCAEFDPHKRYLKPAGFKGALKPHHEYVETGRRPWLYRNGGSAIVPFDDVMGYPRICAHRGFSTVAPENSMPAFGAAISLGAEEIEFDLWETKDGEIVSCHDDKLDRVSNGTGLIYEHTLKELRSLDFGEKFSKAYKGLKIVTFEEILKKYAGHAIMNVHVKTKSDTCGYNEEALHKIVRLIDKYDARRHVYFMSGNDHFLETARRLYPDIRRCCGAGSAAWQIVERAIEYDCCKVQLFKPYFNQEMIDKAHANNITCNVFFADDPEEAIRYIGMGIDTILTNDYLTVSNAVREYLKNTH